MTVTEDLSLASLWVMALWGEDGSDYWYLSEVVSPTEVCRLYSAVYVCVHVCICVPRKWAWSGLLHDDDHLWWCAAAESSTSRRARE